MGLGRGKTGSKDIWSIPPGGLPAEVRRRGVKAPIAFGLAVTLTVGGAVAYSSMKASTAVSSQDVLAEFQAAQEAESGGAVEAQPQRRGDTDEGGGRDRKNASGKAHTRRQARDDEAAVAAAGARRDGGAGGGRGHEGAQVASAGGRSQKDEAPRSRAQDPQSLPREGVYAWQVEGYEQAPGVRRDLPARSHRVITHRDADSWTEHLIFSEEREQWMHLNLHDAGVTTDAVRNRVEMGPVEVDKTVVYNPPVFVARLPNKVGHTWQGSWTGKTSGSYTARTFDHTTVVIEGEEVEVWASEVVMTMRGEVQGRATTRSWYSPKYNFVVKQYQNVNIETGPGEYRSEWTGQVLSVTPQR